MKTIGRGAIDSGVVVRAYNDAYDDAYIIMHWLYLMLQIKFGNIVDLLFWTILLYISVPITI
jgi:hypothetical protein